MKTIKRYLVVKANGDVRVRSTTPTRRGQGSLAPDEVAYELIINRPEAWGAVVGKIDITMPDPPEALLKEE